MKRDIEDTKQELNNWVKTKQNKEDEINEEPIQINDKPMPMTKHKSRYSDQFEEEILELDELNDAI